jgi:hypothetical protein
LTKKQGELVDFALAVVYILIRTKQNEEVDMKHFFSILPVLVIVLSCTTTQTGSGGLKAGNHDYAYEKMVFVDYRFKFEFHLGVLEGDKKIEAAIKDLIYNGKDPASYVADREKSVRESIEKEHRPLQSGEDGSIHEGEYIENVVIKHYGDSFVILRRDDYAYYSGQAHGYSETQYYIVDADEARILSLDELSSALPEEILKNSIAAKHDIDFNFRESVWPPDSISLEREGLLLFWNVYSIASYSDGPIEIIVPYGLANSYLTEKAKLIRDELTK